MTPSKPPAPGISSADGETKTPADSAKAARLAAALRDNLKRRKAQRRAREHEPESAASPGTVRDSGRAD